MEKINIIYGMQIPKVERAFDIVYEEPEPLTLMQKVALIVGKLLRLIFIGLLIVGTLMAIKKDPTSFAIGFTSSFIATSLAIRK